MHQLGMNGLERAYLQQIIHYVIYLCGLNSVQFIYSCVSPFPLANDRLILMAFYGGGPAVVLVCSSKHQLADDDNYDE